MNVMLSAPPKTHYHALFVSDLHLGTRGCKAELLAAFLARVSCDRLYLVGDIIDGWRLRRSWFWDRHHDEVLRLILKMARRGTDVVYIPGNHDEMMRAWLPMELEVAGVRLCERATHVTATGQTFLVLHGDEFDSVVRYAPLLAVLGDQAYTLALAINHVVNAARRRLGLPYRSLSAWLKRQVKGAVMAIDRFEHAAIAEARKHDADGVICGHIHHPVIRTIDGLLYMNDGDWVESCSALVERTDGTMELLGLAQTLGAPDVSHAFARRSPGRTAAPKPVFMPEPA
ncbi:metallophosphoesterase [Ameyamaea chiangmaiensis NBRC 103196]|uniref:UDP-2,3-diacylglucosamine diphosphatase n=1 Tax=Ameyamaea chiangmaiensis TaxID=442969 RepID=A0A850PDM2_9PROT|nr:UDP-2,3-diacylglucosamine diphosphatase [Ameyamaea chiangmaiensis]MBS4076007.1 UDP-2,3-diacylglucosamine diphosphatase [Ameyamaea chiangmaiensis]NVN42108.1 UDP-2,3-diacylglucosamine diphosphatase [Ameyamaea chiangmaiensis]GBQ61473.1 metallophosphoesterase [Ameyamaea chiangmaiensis NBRC 103196]